MKSPHSKSTLLKKRISHRFTQFFLREYFFSHQHRITKYFPPSLLKKIKSPKRSVLPRTDIALYVNRFVDRVVHDFGQTQFHCKKSGDTHNKGLKEMAGEVVNQTFVHLINSYGRLTVCASKPPLL